MNYNGRNIGCGTIILGLIVLDIIASMMSEEPMLGLLIIVFVMVFVFRKPLGQHLGGNVQSQKYEEYVTAIGDYIDTPVSYLANVCGKSEDKVTEDLYEMIGKGYFTNSYFDSGVFVVPGNKKVRNPDGAFASDSDNEGTAGQAATGQAAAGAGSIWEQTAAQTQGNSDDSWHTAAGGPDETDGSEGESEEAYSEDQEKPQAAANGIPCPYCGEMIPRSLKFCYFCGKSLEVIQEIEDLRHTTAETIKDAMSVEMDEEVKKNIVSIGEVSDKILKRFEEEPDLIEDQHRFKDYYLPKTITAIKNYKELCLMTDLDKDERDVKKQIEDSLDTVESAFSRILRKVSIDGIFDLSADVSTLNKALEQEGLTDPDFDISIDDEE